MKFRLLVLPLLLLASACAEAPDDGSDSRDASIQVSAPSLALGTSVAGSAGMSQTYTVEGSDISSAGVAVTAPAGVELRVSGVGAYTSALNLPVAQGTLAPVTIEARISAAAAVGAVSGSISHTASPGGLAQVQVSGTVTAAPPSIVLSTPSLGLGSTQPGVAGATQTYTVSGSGLGSTPITITAPADVELRPVGGTFGPSASLTPDSQGVVSVTTIEIRIAASAASGAGSGVVNHTSGAASEDLAVVWQVTAAVVDQWQRPPGMAPIPQLIDPTKRYGHGLVWLGSGASARLVVWGGITISFTDPATNIAVVYDPAADAFEPGTYKPNLQSGSGTGVPSARHGPLCVAVGDKMFVWGGANGVNSTTFDDGGVYDLASDTWLTGTGAANFENFRTSGATGAPASRAYAAACWTGAATNKILIWGGVELGVSSSGPRNDGCIYDIATDTWSAMSTTNAPSARSGCSAGFIGGKLFIHGGSDTAGILGDGGVYDLALDQWVTGIGPATYEAFRTGTSAPAAVARSSAASAAVSGMLYVYGGVQAQAPGGGCSDGWVYDPATDSWPARTALNAGTNAPGLRYSTVGCTDGSRFLVFGGSEPQPSGPGIYNDGGIYEP
jgi:hypothetical protein